MNNKDIKQAASWFAALGDATRLRLLLALRAGELCACQLIALVDLAPSTVSKHLALLRAAGFVEARKEGRWVHYQLAKSPPFPIVGTRRPPVFQSLEKCAMIQGDERALRKIRKKDMNELCKDLMKKKGTR